MEEYKVPEVEVPEYEMHSFEEVAEALAEIRRQHEAGEPLVWTGPDRLHYSVAATCPEPSWHFSEEGMAYHADQDRDFWDVYTMIAFQIGFHNGYLRSDKANEVYRRDSGRRFG